MGEPQQRGGFERHHFPEEVHSQDSQHVEYTPVTSTLGRPRQENCEFEANMAYILPAPPTKKRATCDLGIRTKSSDIIFHTSSKHCVLGPATQP